jgi:IrrE N-terminal-like domain
MKTNDLIESEIISIALDRLPPPPVDLEAVARCIGIAEVIRTECRAGFTAFDGRSPIVHVSGSIPHAKSRFIIAHELAHVMLRLPRVMSLIRNRRCVALLEDEERLADGIAQTLLMPDAWIESMRTSWVTLVDVLFFAEQADVSPQALIRRMAASRIDLGMLQWRRAALRWAVIDRPGVSSQLHGCLNPTFAGYWALENAGIEESDLLVDCYLNDRHVTVVGTGIREGSDVLQLVRPSNELSAAINGTVDWFKEQMKAALAFDSYGRS